MIHSIESTSSAILNSNMEEISKKSANPSFADATRGVIKALPSVRNILAIVKL